MLRKSWRTGKWVRACSVLCVVKTEACFNVDQHDQPYVDISESKEIEGLSVSVNVSVQGERSSNGDEKDERDELKGIC